jgi:hypothetical protein
MSSGDFLKKLPPFAMIAMLKSESKALKSERSGALPK